MLAALYNKPEAVEAILRAKPNVYLQDKVGENALHCAVENQHGNVAAAAMVAALLWAGAAVDLATFSGLTPLMDAASLGRLEAAKALLQAGSRPELRSPERPKCLGPGQGQRGACLGRAAGERHCLAAVTKRGNPTDSHKVTVHISSRRLAIKSLTRNIWMAEAFRALELVACVLLPLSMTMLWKEPFRFLPVYFLIYTIPALACWRQRALLISPGTRPGLRCPGRLPRAIATVAQLRSSRALREGHSLLHRRRHACGGRDGGLPPQHHGSHATAADEYRASAEMACSARNTFDTWAKILFFVAQFLVAVVSLICVVLVIVDTCHGIMKSAETEQRKRKSRLRRSLAPSQ